MSDAAGSPALSALARFAAAAEPPAAARARAAAAVLDTVGVTLAGAAEPVARIVREVAGAEGGAACAVFGAPLCAGPGGAALANGTAAHALDFDDMCFVSLAHPSAALVPAAFAAAELAGASGPALLDAYIVGFEVEARLGRAMQPRHYQRGWHPTSTLGTIGAAAAASRLLGLDAGACGHALAIAASSASGLKENFGTMVKPLHAGLAARSGVLAARLAAGGLTASGLALDGPQGFLRAMDGQRADLDTETADLGARWEILETGITVKLYPSCAATHPPLDAVLDLCREESIGARDIDRLDVDVDPVTPTVLIHDHPTTGLEAKFSLPFCLAAAVVAGRVGLDTFGAATLGDAAIRAFMPRVSMHVDAGVGANAPPLTASRVRVRLRDGRTLVREARGARGYPDRPAGDAALAAKFLDCASRALPAPAAAEALALLQRLDALDDVRVLTARLRT